LNLDTLAKNIEDAAGADRFSGVVMVTCDGKVALEVAFGLADRGLRVPVTCSTRFGVASLSKTFTAVAVARYVDRGTIRFDAPACELLPAPLRPLHLKPTVTLHHLLCHTSGLADYFDEERLGAAAYGLTWEDVPCYRVRRPVDFLPLFADKPPLAEPGARFAYCNAGYILLGLVLEVLAGEPFADVIQREVFDPAGMADCAYLAIDHPHANLATGYIPPITGDGAWTSNIYSIPPIGAPDGGALCTARDVDRFLEALLNGTLLGKRTLHEVLRAQAEEAGTVYSYGYGLWVRTQQTPVQRLLMGEDPGFSARAATYENSGVRAVVLANISEAAAPIMRQIDAIVLAPHS
jgi:CubicO group peptidase (beta-lactamase class C family)